MDLFNFKVMVADTFDECQSPEEMKARKDRMIKEIENSYLYNMDFKDWKENGVNNVR